jgi:Recombination endonuclease VII
MVWGAIPRPRQRVLGAWDSRAPVRRGRHGLTADEVDALIARQGGACAGCERTDRRLQLDHDHRHCPGSEGCRRCIRGMLCGPCNTALGLLGDDLAILQRLILYLGPR